ncbi:MAG: hypothetical protein HYV27_02925 [Candidatus Hydrogenedentes bacterium]|nr:hypothetical protein [Candidatus Hydrogenedentota bacterium]
MHEPADDPLLNMSEEASIEALDALLLDHAERAVERTVAKLGGPLDKGNLAAFLSDPDCLRYPTSLVFSDEGIDEHQFAEPFFDGDEGGRCCKLHIATRFEDHPELLPLFVAYVAAAINYGQIANTNLCEKYGAGLVQMEQEAYYEALCGAFDSVS